MISLGSRLIACCKLAPTLAKQMWRHNYVIDRNEYLIFTFSESTNPWVYSLQFLFKPTNNSWRYERKCEWVFFFWTHCTFSGLQRCRWQYGSIFIRLAVVASQICKIPRNFGRIRTCSRSRSSRVWTWSQTKANMQLPIVINSSFGSTSYRFRVIDV